MLPKKKIKHDKKKTSFVQKSNGIPLLVQEVLQIQSEAQSTLCYFKATLTQLYPCIVNRD